MGDLLAKKWWLFCNRMRGPMESPGIGRLYFTRGWNPICNPQVKFVFNLIRKEWRNFYCKEPKSSWFPRTYLCNIFLSTSSPIENWFPIFYWISLLCRPKALLCIRPAFRTRQSLRWKDQRRTMSCTWWWMRFWLMALWRLVNHWCYFKAMV